MRVPRAITVLMLLGFVFLAGCGSSSTTSVNQKPPAGMSNVSLTMGDTPPSGVTVLSFQIQVTGATLASSSGSVSILKEPVEVEVTKLQTEAAFLSTAGVAAGTYQSISATFANAKLTIQNNSGAAIGSCANGAVCELQPPINPAAVTYSSAPFPITLTANTPTGLKLDFNLNQSIQSDLSINPTVTFTQLTVSADNGESEMEQIDDLMGQVTAVSSANNQFTLQTGNGQTLTINVNSNTQFENLDSAGLANSFASVQAGQTLEVNAALQSDGSLLATKVELKQTQTEAAMQMGIEGTITSVDSATQFHMVVLNEMEGMASIQPGNPVVVTIASGATFNIDMDGLTVPSGLTFAGASDLMVGQDVQVFLASGSTGTNVTTNQITLRMSQITASVSATSAAGFTLTGLPGLFTTAGITSIQVVVLPVTQYENVSGLSGLSTGNSVSVRGLLFNTPGTPTLIAAEVREQTGP